MSALRLLTYLECKNCRVSIPLLASKHLEKLGGLLWWPTDNTQLNFLCPVCNHVCEYRLLEVQTPTSGTLDRPESNKYLAVFCTSIRCAVENCGAQARVHVVVNQRIDGSKLVEDVQGFQQLVSGAVPWGVVCCEDGHALTKRTFQHGFPLGPSFVASICDP